MRHEYRRAYARNQALKTEAPAARNRAVAERIMRSYTRIDRHLIQTHLTSANRDQALN